MEMAPPQIIVLSTRRSHPMDVEFPSALVVLARRVAGTRGPIQAEKPSGYCWFGMTECVPDRKSESVIIGWRLEFDPARRVPLPRCQRRSWDHHKQTPCESEWDASRLSQYAGHGEIE